MPSRSRVIVLQVCVLLLVISIVLILRHNNHQLYRHKDSNKVARYKQANGGTSAIVEMDLAKEIPATILEKRPLTDVKEYFAKINDIKIFYREAIPVTSAANHNHHHTYQVLLLHGQAFTSHNWDAIGTLSILASMGHRAVAIDLPGYGKSEKNDSGKTNTSTFLLDVVEKLDLKDSLILVSPSMSGRFSLPFVVGHPEKVKGYVPVAPVATGEFVGHFSSIFVPTLIVVGEKDVSIGPVSTKNLKGLPNSTVFTIPGAGHAAYMDQTHIWHKLLYNFLSSL